MLSLSRGWGLESENVDDFWKHLSVSRKIRAHVARSGFGIKGRFVHKCICVFKRKIIWHV